MTKQQITYYCDRCREEIAIYPTICCNTNPRTAIRIEYGEWVYADLCDKCKESFKAWWEKQEVE